MRKSIVVGVLMISSSLMTPTQATEHFSMKGLYIGMPIDEACEVVNNLFTIALNLRCEVKNNPNDNYNLACTESAVIKQPINSNKPRTKNQQELQNKFSFFRPFTVMNQLKSIAGAPTLFKIYADSTKLVNRIVLPAYMVNKLFNTADMSAIDFAQAFIDNYDIPSMNNFFVSLGDKIEPLVGWEFSSPDGFRIRIFSDKAIELVRIPKANDRMFD